MNSPLISRADLLRCKLRQQSLDLDNAAAVLGFFREGATLPSRKPEQETSFDFSKKTLPPITQPVLPPVEQERLHFYRVTRRERLKEESETSAGYPEWYEAQTETLADEQRTSLVPEHQSLKFNSLAPWSRLWPFLHKTLGNLRSGSDLDIDRLIKKWANGELIRRLPLKLRYRWSGSVRLLIDINSHIFPLRNDLIFLHDKLIRQRGMYGLHIQYLDDQPGDQVYCWDKGRAIIERWSPPDQGTPFLIISDLGMLSRSKRILNNWLVFGRKLAMKGYRPTVLMPVPERMIDACLFEYFDCVSWDRSSRLKKLLSTNPDLTSAANHQLKVNQLLSRLAPAVRINPVLLRAIRWQAVNGDFDIGHEAAVWHHPSMQQHGDELVWRSIDHETFLQAFKALTASLQQQVIDLIARYHAQLPEVLYFEAMLNCMQLTPEQVNPTIREATERYMAVLTRTCQEHPEFQGLKRWEGRFLGRQKAEALRKNNKIVGAIEGIQLQRNAEIGQEIVFPVGVDQDLVMPFLGHHEKKVLDLRQKGRELILSPQDTKATQQEFSDSGSLLTQTLTSNNFILRQSVTQQGQSAAHILKFNPGQRITIALAGTRRYELETDWEKITVEPLAKPDWALSIVNDANGLSAESRDSQGNVYSYYWHPPGWDAKTGIQPGFWYYLPVSATSLQPDWATAWGRDQCGLYADVEILKVTQRFRWIEPTSFMMGSKEDEVGRYDNEIQHQVILTQGYWLAETACTQALWQAVMRGNPSDFKGEQLPVENVSYNDVQAFLNKLNESHPMLKLRLPTEAEWENACRAETESAFNFEGEITLEKVNYHGTWDYESDKWGEGALQRTVSVKSYPPNAWGLYEMHGNVWEWCQDWHGDYPSQSITDPQGPESGAGRLLRGGSWIGYGRYCRSALRFYYVPSLRYNSVGFRLARGHELKPSRVLGAGQQPVGSRASGAHGGQTGDGLRGDSKEKSFIDRIKGVFKGGDEV